MDILIKLTVPGHIYRFYHQASAHIANSSAEEVMSDALCAYASLISEKAAQENTAPNPEPVPEGSSLPLF
ncbi:MAG: hypothetical protein IJD98_05195 [Oscillospiraceae bacterium]|nr:hypothetical protein [Oscillospiraceae bacterium]